jgi:uncharacterized caspase-like protein
MFFALDIGQVFDRMVKARARYKFIVLDASRENPFATRYTASKGLAPMSAPAGTMIAYATSPGSTAMDGFGRNGIYTRNILKNIRVPDIPVEIMFKRVREGVERETLKRQIPWDVSSLSGDFTFNPTRNETDRATVATTQPIEAPDLAPRKALVIGNDNYQYVPKLANAREDARAVAKGLETVGFSVTLMLDLNEKSTREAIRTFKAQLNNGDVAIFYYSGHGVQLGGTNYLLPVDVHGDSEDQVKDDAVPLQRILDDLQEQKARFALAIVDACRDNPFPRTGRAIGGRGLAPTTAATGQMILFSAGVGQQALDSLGPSDRNPNGLFTRVFLVEMNKPGVSVDRVLRNVREEVARLAQSVKHEQVPAIYDQALGDFYFRR